MDVFGPRLEKSASRGQGQEASNYLVYLCFDLVIRV